MRNSGAAIFFLWGGRVRKFRRGIGGRVEFPAWIHWGPQQVAGEMSNNSTNFTLVDGSPYGIYWHLHRAAGGNITLALR